MAVNIDELRQQLSNLDFSDVGGWPIVAKGIAIVVLCAAVLGLGFYLDTSNQLDLLQSARDEEEKLKKDFEKKQHKAANLGVYQRQMEEMRESFGAMLRQLPSKTEIAELLVDISQTGLANGLEFQLFKPEKEAPAEFYAELPIKIKVTGDYHQFGNFVSGVAVLPRIVTLHDIKIEHAKNPGGQLVMEATAKTYRYLEEGAE
ncbi:MAG TPA: pilus assembly protein PilO [Gammaproteobacteria bacterium]|nr:pilus assembly protein PilO [Gammaproteobacteria bacterium]